MSACMWSRRLYFSCLNLNIVLIIYISSYVRVRIWSAKNLNIL